MTNIERLRILRTAVLQALDPYQGTGKMMFGCPPCPECKGTLLCHHIGCPVWEGLYGDYTKE